MKKKMPLKRRKAGLGLAVLTSLIMCTACGQKGPVSQPELGHRTVPILQVDGLSFKDLNRNGRLDIYEDWRQSPEARATDLRSQMSTEQKVGMMLISTTRLKNEDMGSKVEGGFDITSEFNEEDRIFDRNMFTGAPIDTKVTFASGTTQAVTKFHNRYFVLRCDPGVRIMAEWSNRLQALCEEQPLGIPAVVASNPRNHITSDEAIGTTLGTTCFSRWPSELGLAAMNDPEMVRTFADIARQEWIAVGLRKGYMYMADLATEPRWKRIEGTFGEDANRVADCIRALVLGFQGDSLNSQSVALTTKHFPGGGATEKGQDPHFVWGRREIFTGQFRNNLIPFRAAIEAGTSAIMPYYSFPVGTEYPELAYAYNKEVLRGLLRGELGFKGIINSDTGPIEQMPWGVEALSISERYALALEAGVNLFSGTADPAELLQVVQSGKTKMEYIDESVQLLLEEMFKLGVFENPYVDPDQAERIAGNDDFQRQADLAQRKSIVLLRNEESILPLKSRTKVYFERYMQSDENPDGTHVIVPEANSWDVEFVSSPAEADVILLWITPTGNALFASDETPIRINLSSNRVDCAYINRLTAQKPTVLVMNYSNPWVIDEIYNERTPNIQGMLATFGVAQEALLDVVTGRFNPTGKLPFATPVSEAAVESNKEDVPGSLEPAGYVLFHCGEGLSYEEESL